ncbi:MAG: GNAT family N-acetyltransferase [Pseudomonadota bacterium]
MTERLFIYGTLAPGRSNHHHMVDIPGDWQPATLRGRLYEEGWGAAAGYPAIVPGEDGDPVTGFIFSSDHLGHHWARLDAFEGEGYSREPVTVTLEDGTRVAAFVYSLNPALRVREGIDGLTIRDERPSDAAAIHTVTADAFRDLPYSDGSEPEVIARLRAAGALSVSLVAELDGDVVGYVAFSPVVAHDGSSPWFALGPVAVAPALHGHHIGSALITTGLATLEEKGALGCMLLGDARYYARFGFKPAPANAPDAVPAEYFMLRLSGKAPPNGVLDFHPAIFGGTSA